jgi:hypothetical protein
MTPYVGGGRMRRICLIALVVVLAAAAARAQDSIETVKVGVSAAAGLPAGLAGLRLSVPAGPKLGVDFSVTRLTGIGGLDEMGPAYITHVRWMRGGRAASGEGRYWIFGVLFMDFRTSTLIIYPGNVRKTIYEDQTWLMPRFGYGWDHVTRRGTRYGLELTTGAAGEEAGLMLANVFLMWGPPRK